MPNRDGQNTGPHPNRQVGGYRWGARDFGYMNSSDPRNHLSFTMMPGYDQEGYGEVYSNAAIGPGTGRTHTGFMAAYERHGGRLHPNDPTPRFEAGPFSNPTRAQMAAVAMRNRDERGGDLSMYER